MADSTATFTGGLGKDPELRFGKSGTAACNFTVAVSKRVKKGDEWEESTSWIDCVAFGSLAENLAASCNKGTRVVVTGTFEQREWEDHDTGEKRSKLAIIADDVAPSLRWATAVVEKNPRKER